VDNKSLAHDGHGFTLLRVHPNGTQEYVSDHPDLKTGWQAGTARTHTEQDVAFSLFDPSGQRVARFGHARLTPRFQNVNLDALILS